ncbi:MAG: PQQ-dependent sugar dehydrogenase [Treponemataceae bacterium]|nr:PQQ-dependent sugar dehydrogenase [Treponemataceae bacterium]
MCALLFSACERSGKVRSISEDNLFSIEYGNFEEQLNLFGSRNFGGVGTALAMRDGFFYIVNGEAQKILSFNSYGDLLSVYYNEDAYSETNAGLPKKSSAGIWRSVSYPFHFNGRLAVDSRKFLYVVASVPKERSEQDEADNLLYSQMVLRFSSDGSVIDYIGQQGPAGTPFPYIQGLYATENDELVVVCSTNDGLCAYWFATNGFLRYQIPVTAGGVPRISPDVSGASDQDLFISIDTMVPDCYAERIYVKVDYYMPYIDEESKVQSGVSFVESAVYPLDIGSGVYGEPVVVPPFEESITEDFSKLTFRQPYDFLGVTKNGWFFFIITTEDGFYVELIQPASQYLLKRHFAVNHAATFYYSLALSHEGIISALLAGKDDVKAVWWRTDNLIASILKS